MQVNGYSIKPTHVVGFAWDLSATKKNHRPASNLNTGVLSEKQAYRLRNAINWMQYLSEGKFYTEKKTKKKYRLRLNMITVTLCAKQKHSDEFLVHHLLRPFLKWMARKGSALYVWRAEAQSNGNIHFHITGNKFLDKNSIQLKWNSLLQVHGYLRDYIQAGGDDNPPSTDVVGNRQSHKLAGYLIKYMSKAKGFNRCQRYCALEEKPIAFKFISDYRIKEPGVYEMIPRPVECKLWSCSTELANQRRNISELDLYYRHFQDFIAANSDRKIFATHFINIYKSLSARDYCFMIQKHCGHVSPVELMKQKMSTGGQPAIKNFDETMSTQRTHKKYTQTQIAL